MKKFELKSILPEIIILLIFVLAAAIYFYPALQGKVVYAGDNINGTAACHEGNAYLEETGEQSFWTGSMFSGMPNFQMGGHGEYLIDQILHPIRWFFSWGNRNTFFIFLFYLCAFFLLLRAFKVDKWVSMAGAFAIALSSYFFIIIAAQHHGKCYSITWMTLVVVGFLLTYRKQYAWGAVLVMFFTYIGFFLHPQMSYYICMMLGIFFFAELATAAKNKEWKHFLIATAVFGVSFLVGLGMGSANVFVNQEYAKETMRGGHSDLVKANDATNKTAGLDLDYATAWSYGRNETMTLLIPNYMGGASGYHLDKESVLYNELVKEGVPKSSAKQFCENAPTYWGEKAFTSGPVYIGAIICFLFILALLIVEGPYKWALLAATLFSILLAWGHNFMSLTEFFFRYFPVYNKFRAVESILIVAEITMPLLAMLALKELDERRQGKQGKIVTNTAFAISFGIVALLCLVPALFTKSLCSCISTYDTWASQMPDYVYDAIIAQRESMIRTDAWRSLLFIVFGAGLAWIYSKGKLKNVQFGCILAALIVVDMWTVDKRFCNDACFTSRKGLEKSFAMLPYEKQLLATDTSYYRVLNTTTNTFNEARTSYYFHSIGGYSAAKLRRYQDLIDEHISRNNWSVLNMLNTKYVIVNGNGGQPQIMPNPEAYGNCWFVDSLVLVDNANAESDALRELDLRHIAVADKTFAPNANIERLPEASTLMAFDEEKIECTEYRPNRLTYLAQVETPKLAVFSEIYYQYGWIVTIDGQPAPAPFRVDYALRALRVPAGQHTIVFTFNPDSVKKGNTLSLCCLGVFVLTLIGAIVWTIRKRKNAA